MINSIIKKINSISNSNSIKSKLFKGSFWLSLGGSADVGLKLIRNMVLARLIAPESFGTMALILAVNTLFETFTAIGIKEAIIQSEHGLERSFLNGAWWVSLARGCALLSIGFISAPFVSDFYGLPELTKMLRVSLVTLLFITSSSPRIYTSLKEMDFKPWILGSFIGSFSGIVTSIVLSFFIDGTWALIIGYVTEAVGKNSSSYIMRPFKPTFDFNKIYIKKLLSFSKGMFGLPLMTFIFLRTDIFVIGKLCPQAEVGIYSLAVQLARMPGIFMEKFVSPIMMPAFSSIQKDDIKINRWILDLTFILSIIGIPAIVFIFFNSSFILKIIYGNRYIAAAIPFSFLFMNNILRSISVPLVAVYFSKGRPEMNRQFTIIRTVLLLIIIYPCTKFWGLIGASCSVFSAMLISYVFQINRLHMLTNLNVINYYKLFVKSLYFIIPLCILFLINKVLFPGHIIVAAIINSIYFVIALIVIIKKLLLPYLIRIKNT